MAYQNEKQAQTPVQDEKARPEEQLVPEQLSFGIPNSMMMAMLVPPPPGTPNSVMREMMDEQIPEAGSGSLSSEALSRPKNSVRRQTDRAVSFRRGFNPIAGAHEAGHTIWRNTAQSHVSLSVPGGTIQRERKKELSLLDDDAVLEPLWGKRPSRFEKFKEKAKGFFSFFRRSQKNEEDPVDRDEERDEEGGIDAGGAAARDARPAPGNLPRGAAAGNARPAPVNAPFAAPINQAAPAPKFGQAIQQLKNEINRLRMASQERWVQDRLADIPEKTAILERRKVQGQAQDPEMQQRRKQIGRQDSALKKLKRRIENMDVILQGITRGVDELSDSVPNDQKRSAPTPQAARKIDLYRRRLNSLDQDFNDLRNMTSADHVLPDRQQPQQAGGAVNNPPAEISQQEKNDTFRIQNGEAQKRHRYGSSFTMDPARIEKIAAQYRHDYWREHFVDEDGNEKQPQNISGPINYGLQQAANVAGGGAPAPGQPQAAAAAPAPGQPQAAAQAPDPGRHLRRTRDASAYMGLARNAVGGVNNLGKTIYLGEQWQHTTGSSLKLPRNTYGNWVNPIGGGILDVAGLGAGLTGMATSGIDSWNNFRNIKNKKGTSGTDAALSSMDTIAQLAKSVGGAWGMVQNFGNAGSNVPIHSFGGAGKGVPIVGAVAGGIDTLTGSIEGVRGMYQSHKISQQIEKLEDPNQPNLAATPVVPGGKTDQQKLLEIAKQGRAVQRINAASGWMKAGAGALSLASGVTSATGVGAPVGLGLSMLSAFLSGVRFAFNVIAKHNLRKKVLGDEFGIDWGKEMDDVQDMVRRYNPNMSLNRDERKQVLLKAHGSDQTDIKKAFQETNLKRARYLLSLADPNNRSDFQQVATAVIEAMGIKQREGRFAAGADELLAKKLT